MDFHRFHKFVPGADKLVEHWRPPVGPGWFPLLYRALSEIDALVVPGETEFKVGQIKEKFGTLRFYVDVSGPPEIVEKINAIADQAERETETTCEECGKLGKTSDWHDGYYQTLCADHAIDAFDRNKRSLPAYPTWRLERNGRIFKLLMADGRAPTLDDALKYAIALADKIDAGEKRLETIPHESAAWKALFAEDAGLRTELTWLLRGWFLARCDGPLDARISAYRAEKLGP